MFQPRGRHEILKHGRQVYIFLSYLLRLERMCSTLTWFLCSSPMSLPSLACTCDLHEECAHIFYSVAKTSMFNSVSRICCHFSTIFIKITSASENQIFFCEDYSLWNFGCPQMRRMSFFTRGQGKIFRDPRITWRYSILHFSFENVINGQKSETILNFRRCKHL